MNDFQKLKAPSSGSRGFYVATIEDEPTAWLTTTNGDLTSSTLDFDILFFNTEEDAYRAALVYYNKHNEVYPFTMTVTIGTMENDTDGSQVMEFE